MGASAYVGRVGGLAVALGVGIAVTVGGNGVAWAEGTSDPDGATSQESSPDTGSTGDEPSTPTSSGLQSDTTPKPSSDPADPPAGNTPVSTVSAQSGSTVNGEKAGSTVNDEKAGSTDNDEKAVDEKAVDKEVVDEKEAVIDEAEEKTVAVGRDVAPSRSRVLSRVNSSRKLASPTSQASTLKTPEPSSRAVITDTSARQEPVVQRPVAADVAATTTAVVTTVSRQVATTLAAVAPTPAPAPAPVTRVVSRLLAAFGLGSASNLPVAPTQPWVLGALMALATRRETERVSSTAAISRAATTTSATTTSAVTTSAALVDPPDPATSYPVTPVPVSANTDFLTAVTGRYSQNETVSRFGIGGTDLGIMWDNGIRDNPLTAVNEHQVLIAFGDTFSSDNPVRINGWRNNTLFRSYDNVLSNGIYVRDGIIHDPGTYSGSPMSVDDYSREIIGKYGYAVGPEVTIIPTAAISVPGAGVNGATRQYINVMSVRSWDTPGRWTTNYSAIAYSDDNGQNWRTVPVSSVRAAAAGRSTQPFVSGNQNFQQFAYVKGAVVDANGVPVKDAVTGQPKTDGYVYAFGTPAGRGGTAYLSRVKEMEILDQTKYQYWNGSAWVNNNPAAAKPILPGTTTSSWFGLVKTTTYPTVGEMSVQYNAYEKKYVMLYADQNNNVVMRKADRPEGPWSAPTTLVTSTKMPGLYAPMIHPWSSTDNVSSGDQQYLYWNISTWDDYQVKTMRTDLSKV